MDQTLRPHGEPFSLNLSCVWCGGDVHLQMNEWPQGQPDQPQEWACPWCQRACRFSLGGVLRFVVRGHHDQRRQN